MPRRVVSISNALFGGRRTYRKTESKIRVARPRLHKFSRVFWVVKGTIWGGIWLPDQQEFGSGPRGSQLR
jgi:hypothetical protein